MKTASTFLQTLALTALLAAQVHGALSMPGVRRTLRAIADASVQSMPIGAPIEFASGV